MRRQALLFVLAFPALGLSQSFTLDWHAITGGGGASGSGRYSLRGRLSPSGGGGATAGGRYTLTGGIWNLFVVQTPGAPTLSITSSGTQAIISWPVSSSGWTLQTNGDLVRGVWVNYGAPVTGNSVTNPPAVGNLFFRLARP